MGKHKREHRWVIVRHGAALMTYEYLAFFFTDNFDDDDKPVYYNQITDKSIDIWSLAYRSKRTAEIVLKELSSIEKKSREENPQYTQEEKDYWEWNGEMPVFNEEWGDDITIVKVYNYPYANPKRSKTIRKIWDIRHDMIVKRMKKKEKENGKQSN